MFTSNERGIRKQAQVDFTRSGWRQFFKLNRSLGARFIRGFVLRYELAAYLTAHEAAGTELDEGCQEVCYENDVYLLLRKMQQALRGQSTQEDFIRSAPSFPSAAASRSERAPG